MDERLRCLRKSERQENFEGSLELNDVADVQATLDLVSAVLEHLILESVFLREA